MARKILIGLLVFCLVMLACGIGFVVYMETRPAVQTPETTAPVTEAPETTEAPTTVPTEPPEAHFLLTFVGDCTFGANPSNTYAGYGFPKTVGEDYQYPFRNVIDWFDLIYSSK